METTEKELIERVKTGDLLAFDGLVEKYQHKVYSIAYRFMGNHSDASDLAQEAFIKVYQGLDKYRGEASLLTWIYQIVANVCRDELRKRQRCKVVPLEQPRLELRDARERSNVVNYGNPEEVIMKKEAKEHMQKLLDSLPDDYRLILIMREFQGLSYDEMAQQLDCSLGTIKSRLSRARNALKNKVIANKEVFGAVQEAR